MFHVRLVAALLALLQIACYRPQIIGTSQKANQTSRKEISQRIQQISHGLNVAREFLIKNFRQSQWIQKLI